MDAPNTEKTVTHDPSSAISDRDAATRPRTPLPQGYRQGVITAITVLLGFTLAFFRFWSFEAPGHWTAESLIAAGGLTGALVLQTVALFRSLRLEDDDAAEYRVTVRWFVASAVVLGLTLVAAAVVYSGVAASPSSTG